MWNSARRCWGDYRNVGISALALYFGMNPFDAETGMFWEYWSIPLKLIPGTVRSSATLMLAMQDKQVIVFTEEGFQLPVPPQYWEIIDIANSILPLSLSRLEGYCCYGPGRQAGGYQTCWTHTSVTAWWIFSVPSSVELSRPVVVHSWSFAHLPHMGLPMGQKLVKFATNWFQILGNTSETAGWIYPI